MSRRRQAQAALSSATTITRRLQHTAEGIHHLLGMPLQEAQNPRVVQVAQKPRSHGCACAADVLHVQSLAGVSPGTAGLRHFGRKAFFPLASPPSRHSLGAGWRGRDGPPLGGEVAVHIASRRRGRLLRRRASATRCGLRTVNALSPASSPRCGRPPPGRRGRAPAAPRPARPPAARRSRAASPSAAAAPARRPGPRRSRAGGGRARRAGARAGPRPPPARRRPARTPRG